MRLRRRQRELRDAARRLFTSDDGRRVLHWMMKRGHVLGGCFDDVPTRHALFEGERNMVLEVMDLASLSSAELESFYRTARFDEAAEHEEEND